MIGILSLSLLLLSVRLQALSDWRSPNGDFLDAGHIGIISHNRERRLEDWEDKDLPVPAQIHFLGHRSRNEGAFGRTKPVDGLRSSHRRTAQGDMTSEQNGLITPLYQGYGTHFSYVYVGTPPQRQSVIVDTGSHYTAFPCTGCAQCGAHTDKYWDLKNSTTARVSKCGKDPCSFGQSYSEGSSWKAFKVHDKFWVGGLTTSQVAHGEEHSIDFMFGCQTSETGLFRTQLADGIMGMAMASDTLPYQLVEQKVASANVFAMCFRYGGGIMTIGGVDQRIHSRSGIFYAGIRTQEGWFTVTLMDVQLINQQSKTKTSVGMDQSKYNSGKGPIVDSGTTDTYLPSSIAGNFKTLFKQISGVTFSNANIRLTEMDLVKMPDIVFVLKGEDGTTFDVVMPWTNYIDKVGEGKFAFRIYLTEGSGAVLGANFMNGYNVIFDHDRKRVGFAKSDCKYEDFVVKETLMPTVPPTPLPTEVGSTANPTTAESGNSSPDSSGASKKKPKKTDNTCAPIPTSKCTASCRKESGSHYMQSGTQAVSEPCDADGHTLETPKSSNKPCNQPCEGTHLVRGVPDCPEKAWSECGHECVQSREFPNSEELTAGTCHYTTQTRPCYSGACPIHDGDMLIFIDMRVAVSPQEWTYVHREVFFGALSRLFNVKVGSVDLLNDASSEYTRGVKLHFQIRMKAKAYKDKTALVAAAEAIPRKVWLGSFGDDLIEAIEAESQATEHIDFSRYGYLKGSDVEVLNAAALPVGDVRDPISVPNEGGSEIIVHIQESLKNREDYLLLGVAIASLSCMMCACCLYLRVQRENNLLIKEKIESSTLMRVYNKFQGWREGQPRSRIDSRGKYSQLEMLEMMSEHGAGNGKDSNNPLHDGDLDEDDVNG